MDDLIVSLAGFVRIRLQSVGNVGVCLVDVDMVEKVMIHEITIALVVVTGEAFVLVEVDAVNLGEIQIAVARPRVQLGSRVITEAMMLAAFLLISS